LLPFEFLFEYLPLVLNGLILTVEVTLFGIFVGLALGIVLAIGDMHGGKVVSTLIRFYVEFFRGTPIIVQLFMFQYVIPGMLHLSTNTYVTAFSVFALNSGAYQKGYVKGAMEAVFEDQMMAGLSIGMSKAQTIFYVVLPQALRIVIPAWSNEFCSLTKSTAALAIIGLLDLTGAGWQIMGIKYRVLETWVFVAIIYLIWITIVAKIADTVYERKKIPGIEISA
jgi:His/Glu/Gln/Arg/opine family amino acid ABC transporter permease subunit